MPIIRIQSLPPKKYVEIEKTLANLCIRVADALGISENQVWATWEELKANFYVEGGKSASEQPTSTHPPLVEVQALEGKSPQQIEELLELVSQNLGELLKIDPENLFLSYKEFSKGKTWSAGSILK